FSGSIEPSKLWRRPTVWPTSCASTAAYSSVRRDLMMSSRELPLKLAARPEVFGAENSAISQVRVASSVTMFMYGFEASELPQFAGVAFWKASSETWPGAMLLRPETADDPTSPCPWLVNG